MPVFLCSIASWYTVMPNFPKLTLSEFTVVPSFLALTATGLPFGLVHNSGVEIPHTADDDEVPGSDDLQMSNGCL